MNYESQESFRNANNVEDQAVYSERDYYADLGVEATATPEEIKDAFRRLAIEHHPDKTGSDHELFARANNAYEVLRNAQWRQRYDGLHPTAAKKTETEAGPSATSPKNYEYKSAPDPESETRPFSADTYRETEIERISHRFDEIMRHARTEGREGESKTQLLQSWLKRFMQAQNMVKFYPDIWEAELNDIAGIASEPAAPSESRMRDAKERPEPREKREYGPEKYSLAERQQCYTDFIIAQAPHLKKLRKDERFNAPYIARMKNFVAAVGKTYKEPDFDVEAARKNFADMIADDKRRNNIP